MRYLGPEEKSIGVEAPPLLAARDGNATISCGTGIVALPGSVAVCHPIDDVITEYAKVGSAHVQIGLRNR